MRSENAKFALSIDSFKESMEETEKASINRALDLIPDNLDDEDPDQYLTQYDSLLQRTIRKAIEQSDGDEHEYSLSAKNQYSREVSKITLLTPDQEKKIAKKAFQGDAEAKNLLVEHNLRLVGFIVKRYLKYGVDYEDLIQEGNIGLIQAAERYDYRKGFKFSTYAAWWIRKSIVKCLADQGHPLPVPETGHRDIANIQRAIELYAEQNRDSMPSIQEISEMTGKTGERIQYLLRASIAPLSIHAPNPVTNHATFEDIIADPRVTAPSRAAEHTALFETIREALYTELSPKERHIIELRYGLIDGQPRVLQEIGDEYGLSRERINVIIKRAQEKLLMSRYAPSIREFAEGL